MDFNISTLDTKSALKLLNDFNNSIMLFEDEVKFHFDCTWVQPLGMLLSIAGIRSFRNSNKEIPFIFSTNNECKALDYASHMGFFKAISEMIKIGNEPGQALGNENYIPITIIDFDALWKKDIADGNIGTLNETIERESKRLSKVLCRSNVDLQKLFTYIIRELLRNIPEHAESHKAYICAQYWQNNSLAEIAIADEGIGIKNSLRKNNVHKDYIYSNIDALECAIKPGISQSFSPSTKIKKDDTWTNSGFGLYMTSEICKKLNGEFWIISGDKALEIDSKEKKIHNTFLEGTAIGIKFNASHIQNAQQLITETAKQGEEIAKTIRNAFQNASEPSKSLLIT